MPAERGSDAERFAAAVETGIPPGSAADAELMRDLEIVAMLRSRGAAYAPDPEAKARAKQRLTAMLAGPPDGGQPPRIPLSVQELSMQEQTAPLGRLLTPAFPVQSSSPVADAVVADVTTQFDVVPAAVTGLSAAVGHPTSSDPTSSAGHRFRRRSGRHTLANRPAARAHGSRGPAHGVRRRAVLVGSAALVMLVALTGAGIFASRDALPGDGLYALKRVAESAGLALTFDDAAKARRHLQLATTRLDEVEQMVARQPRMPADPELLQSTIRDFDDSAGTGSRMLLARDEAGGAAGLGDLRAWADEQAARLSVLRTALPVPAVAEAEDSIQLIDRLRGRTEALEYRSSCTEVTSDTVDDLGPLPAEGSCAPRPADRSAASGGASSTGTSSSGAGPGAVSAAADPSPTGPAAAPTTTTPVRKDDTGLLPGLDGPDAAGLPGQLGANPQAGASSTSTAPGDAPSSPASRQLLPPVTLPPLIPGHPGITLG